MVTDLWRVSAKIDTPRLCAGIQNLMGISQRRLMP